MNIIKNINQIVILNFTKQINSKINLRNNWFMFSKSKTVSG